MEAWRTAIIEEAKTWLRTPWHHAAQVKGAGVDCGQLIIACYIAAGVVKPFATGDYPPDWMLHQDEERYLGWVETYLDEVETPRPGDVVTWRYGKCFSHGAILVDYPIVIHAYRRERNVCYGDATRGDLAREHQPEGGSAVRQVRYYSIAGRL